VRHWASWSPDGQVQLRTPDNRHRRRDRRAVLRGDRRVQLRGHRVSDHWVDRAPRAKRPVSVASPEGARGGQ